VLPDGRLAIAKFSKPDDIRDIAAGEILALTLAKRGGIRVPEHTLVSVKGRNASVITRFDREGEYRVPFISANTMLALAPGDPGAYTLIADGIRQFGYDAGGDLRELWRRLVFSLLASNYDDHLRNHGFLMRAPGRWALSPAYDLNPVPEIDRRNTPKTAITEDQEEPSLDVALEAAPRFGIKRTEAISILTEVTAAVTDWRKIGKHLRIKAATLDAYASAFENPLMDEARKLL
jgi:serine/threonine-protein kinase HipA